MSFKNTQPQYVLNFLTVEESKKIFFTEQSILIINYLLKKVLFSQPELTDGEKAKNIQITKEFLETWIAQAFNLKSIGAGSYPIDVYSEEKKFGIDVKFVSSVTDNLNNFTRQSSNETSLAQNFSNEGRDLDQFFKEERYKDILEMWITLLTRKMNKAKNDLNLEKIYYAIFIRGGETISLAIAEFKTNNISTLNVFKSTTKSVFVSNFIDTRYGNVKIYKNKKRMELRVNPQKMCEDDLLHKWDFSKIYIPQNIKLSSVIHDCESFNKYIKAEFEKLFFED